MTETDIKRFRESGWRFVASISGGGSAFLSDYLATPGASASFLEGLVPYSPESTDLFLGFSPDQYCSEKTARQLASRALRRALELDARRMSRSGEAKPLGPLAGVGVTASLASDRPKKGEHRAYCAVALQGAVFSAQFTLDKGSRTRAQEERITADFILSTLLFAAETVRANPDSQWREHLAPLTLATDEPLFPNDRASVAWTAPGERVAALLFPTGPDAPAALRSLRGTVDRMRDRSGRERAFGDTRGESSGAPKVLYPGSFNPPHRGHLAIARIAAEKLHGAVELEISARNVDKPPVDALELARRLAALERALPDAPVWISNAPRYVEKAQIFPHAAFVMGTDTVLRLADPKYESNSIQKRDEALASLRAAGVSICVFARAVHGKILSPEELKEKLPDALTEMCQFVPESEFRDDVSSSELRKSAEQ
ncbi:MAG: hypothetical protein IIU43_13455 [Thermoguttaceae bacterium]|nr:hypothetical protein [Thermoguttaceae bacterium]